MLNPYFAFGVPLFLLLLYVVFAFVRKKTTIHYLGFVLLLIATFMMSFSFQVLQEFWTMEDSSSVKQLNYAPKLLWLPLFLGSMLAIINIYRGIKRVQSFRKDASSKK